MKKGMKILRNIFIILVISIVIFLIGIAGTDQSNVNRIETEAQAIEYWEEHIKEEVK